MRRRILHVAALPFPSNQGTQVYIRQMCENQAREGHDVHLLTYYHGMDGYRPERYSIHRLSDFPKFRSLRSGPSWKKIALDFRMVPAIDKVIREIHPHIIHAHNYEGLAISLMANAARLPLLYHAHTLLEPELPCYFKGRMSRTAAGISGLVADRFLPALAGASVTISQYLCEALIAHGVKENRVFYLPPSLDLGEEGASRGKPLPYGSADFVYIGNLDEYQGICDLMQGISRLARIRNSVTFKFISDSDPDDYAALARSLGISRIVLFERHGDFSTAAARLKTSRIALAPRKIPGGFPMKLINYLQARKPVIASVHGSGGLRHGKEAMVYSGIDDFVQSALELLTHGNLRSRIARAGCRYAQEKFTWDRSLAILDKVYDQLLDCRAGLKPQHLRNSLLSGSPER